MAIKYVHGNISWSTGQWYTAASGGSTTATPTTGDTADLNGFIVTLDVTPASVTVQDTSAGSLGTLLVSGSISMPGGTSGTIFTMNSGTLSVTGTLTFSPSVSFGTSITYQFNCPVTVTGAIVQAGTTNNCYINFAGATTFTNASLTASMSVSFNSTATITSTAVIFDGTLSTGDADLNFVAASTNVTFDSASSIICRNGAQIHIDGSALVTINGACSIDGTSLLTMGVNYLGGTLTIGGTLTLLSGASMQISINAVGDSQLPTSVVNGSGTIIVSSGANIQSGGGLTFTTKVNNNGTLDASGAFSAFQPTKVSGNGTMKIPETTGDNGVIVSADGYKFYAAGKTNPYLLIP